MRLVLRDKVGQPLLDDHGPPLGASGVTFFASRESFVGEAKPRQLALRSDLKNHLRPCPLGFVLLKPVQFALRDQPYDPAIRHDFHHSLL